MRSRRFINTNILSSSEHQRMIILKSIATHGSPLKFSVQAFYWCLILQTAVIQLLATHHLPRGPDDTMCSKPQSFSHMVDLQHGQPYPESPHQHKPSGWYKGPVINVEDTPITWEILRIWRLSLRIQGKGPTPL